MEDHYYFDPHPDLTHFHHHLAILRSFLYVHKGERVLFQKFPKNKIAQGVAYNLDPPGKVPKHIPNTIPEIDAALDQALENFNPVYLHAAMHPDQQLTQAKPVIEPQPQPEPKPTKKPPKQPKHPVGIPPDTLEKFLKKNPPTSVIRVYYFAYNKTKYDPVQKMKIWHVSVSPLAKRLKYSDRTIEYALSYLRRKYYIRLISRGYPQPTDPLYLHSRYELPFNYNHTIAWRRHKGHLR